MSIKQIITLRVPDLQNRVFIFLKDKLHLPVPSAKMGVKVKTAQAGDGINKLGKGDTVIMWYRGYVYAEQTPENKGYM